MSVPRVSGEKLLPSLRAVPSTPEKGPCQSRRTSERNRAIALDPLNHIKPTACNLMTREIHCMASAGSSPWCAGGILSCEWGQGCQMTSSANHKKNSMREVQEEMRVFCGRSHCEEQTLCRLRALVMWATSRKKIERQWKTFTWPHRWIWSQADRVKQVPFAIRQRFLGTLGSLSAPKTKSTDLSGYTAKVVGLHIIHHHVIRIVRVINWGPGACLVHEWSGWHPKRAQAQEAQR